MKRITALLLALVMCFALCACGSTPDPNLKEEDLSGTWSPSLWFLSTQLKLNSDGTYDYGEEKGTFGVLINNVTLSPRHSNANHDYVYSEGYLYSTRFSFDEDEEYGRAFSPDENGMASQKFSCNLGDGLMFDPALVENSIELTLYNDGTFSIFTSVFRYSSSLGYYFNDKPFTTYKGTYKYTAPILTLTYDETDYPLIVKDGVIYFLTFSK